MSSGVACKDDCATSFNDMKIKHDKRYVIYKIENKKEIIIEEVGGKEKSYADFKAKLLALNEPRYCVVDFDYETEDGRPQEKLVFVFWCPDTSGVKDKMLYAASKDAIKKPLTGIHAEVQANDAGDIDEAELKAKCERK